MFRPVWSGGSTLDQTWTRSSVGMQSQLANQRSQVSIPTVVKQNFRLPGFDDGIATPNHTAPEYYFIYLDWYETDLNYPYYEYRLSRNEKENDLFMYVDDAVRTNLTTLLFQVWCEMKVERIETVSENKSFQKFFKT